MPSAISSTRLLECELIGSLVDGTAGCVTANGFVTLPCVSALAYVPAVDEPTPPRLLDDAALARRVAGAGLAYDRDAEAELCRRLAPRVQLYGQKHLRDSHMAADLVQQVLLTMLERLRDGGLREPDRLTSFVLGMC